MNNPDYCCAYVKKDKVKEMFERIQSKKVEDRYIIT